MRRLPHLLILAVVLFTQFACSMNTLPRNMSLQAFNPHRPDFECKHEADAVPPIDPEAEQWLRQGLAATSADLWPNQRDYKKAAELWTRAAERKHWKAMLNLASLYAHGRGVERDAERAVQIVEEAMKLGIPGAYDLMGTYHMEGLGVNQDASRAYAFWQLAADMGSPSAMAYLGSKMDAIYDDPKAGFWGNRPVALKMLECGFAQGNAKAAFQLGLTLDGDDKELGQDYSRALKTLHEGVKLGSEESAGSLFSAFNSGKPLVGKIKDRARAERYSVLSDALWRNPDLLLPNLDKILPLPPAQLPKWDGDEQKLIDAAKGLVPAPVVKPTPGSDRTGRAHIPDGYVLPTHPTPAISESGGRGSPLYGQPVDAQYESTAARFTGYWLPQLLEARGYEHEQWNRAQVPQHYARGEGFARDRAAMGLHPAHGRIMWHYMGIPVQRAAPGIHPRVAQGVARISRIPEPWLTCKGSAPCPRTGIWRADVKSDHPYASVYNHWAQQAYVEKGQQFPDPRDRHLDIAPHAVSWLWLDNANDLGFGSFPDVTLTDLHHAEGKPVA